jgi:ubiquinone/menaquinone biosynthesis C-methylase UbiE
MQQDSENEKLYNQGGDRLRSPERLTLMEIARVVHLCLEDFEISSVLDVGTGTAVFAEAFASVGLTVQGVDSNPEFLTIARTYLPNAIFQQACADKLPFEDQEFDLVFLGHVLHETIDPQSALKEAHRVACKRVAILEWPYIEEIMGPPLAHRLSPETIETLALEAGFQSIEHLQLSHMDLYLLAL